jgi:hypothetical protein
LLYPFEVKLDSICCEQEEAFDRLLPPLKQPSKSWQQEVKGPRNAEVRINLNQNKRRWQFIATFAHNADKSFSWIPLRSLIIFRFEDDLMARAGDESFHRVREKASFSWKAIARGPQTQAINFNS